MAKCTKCGSKLRGGASFCSECGAGVEGGEAPAVCPECSNAISPEAKFCGKCGHKLGADEAPVLATGNRWARGPMDFAARIEVQDVKGFFSKGITVEQGTRAIMLIEGRNEGVLALANTR